IDAFERAFQAGIDGLRRGSRGPGLLLPGLVEVLLLGKAVPHAVGEVGEQGNADHQARQPEQREDTGATGSVGGRGASENGTAGVHLLFKTRQQSSSPFMGTGVSKRRSADSTQKKV